MTISDQIIARLESTPSFRERKFRANQLRDMVYEKNGVSGVMFVPIEKVKDLIDDYMSYERIWRDVLSKKRPDLQGEDWGDGKILDQKFQLEVLGKEVGYHGDLARA